VFFFKTNPYE